jgi:hypothetical protein
VWIYPDVDQAVKELVYTQVYTQTKFTGETQTKSTVETKTKTSPEVSVSVR